MIYQEKDSRFQPHIHTRGDSMTCLEEVLGTADLLELDHIAVTNHNRLANPEANRAAQLNHRVRLIRGIEMTAEFTIHIIGLFPNENAFPEERLEILMGVERTIEWIKKWGFAGLAHPKSALPQLLINPKQFQNLDFIETLSKAHGKNGRSLLTDLIWAMKLKGIGAEFGAGDIHFPYPRDPGYNFETLIPRGLTISEAIIQRRTIPRRNDLKLSPPTLRELLGQQRRALYDEPKETGLFSAIGNHFDPRRKRR